MALYKPTEVKLVTSDDIFDALLDIRFINAKVNRNKEELSREYLEYKFSDDVSFFDDYDEFKKRYNAKKNLCQRLLERDWVTM